MANHLTERCCFTYSPGASDRNDLRELLHIGEDSFYNHSFERGNILPPPPFLMSPPRVVRGQNLYHCSIFHLQRFDFKTFWHKCPIFSLLGQNIGKLALLKTRRTYWRATTGKGDIKLIFGSAGRLRNLPEEQFHLLQFSSGEADGVLVVETGRAVIA